MDNRNPRLTWWQRRTPLEVLIVCLIVLVVIGIIVILILIATKDFSKNVINKEDNDRHDIGVSDICTNADCLKSAMYVKESMDIRLDPCEDFYAFACGKWNEKHPVPDDQSEISVFIEKHKELAVRMNMEIEKPKDLNEPRAIQDGKEVYKICMNTAVADMHGKDRFLHWVSEYGGWPMTMKNWNESAFDWEDVMLKLTKDSSYYFISVTILPDAKNTSSNAVYLTFADPIMDSKYYMDPNKSRILKAYRKMMLELTSVMASGSKVSQAEIDELLTFEMMLANISSTQADRVSLDKMTISELGNATQNQFDWLKYITGVFKDVTNVTENFLVIVPDLSPFPKFFKAIKAVNNRTIANYLMWKYFFKYSPQINNETREILLNFQKIASGIQGQESRQQVCMKFLNKYYPHVMGSLFVKAFVQNGTKKQAVDMVNDLRISLGNILKENTWMDVETLRKAQEKADFMIQLVAYPEWTVNDTYINEYYENLKPSAIHIQNVRNVLSHQATKTHSKILNPVDRSSWPTSSNTINAFYGPAINAIVLPAGILRSPFFEANNIKAMNFGAVGAVIGHEITHAFDTTGGRYDKHGKLFQWWSNSSLDAYHNKSECIRNQYSNYCSSMVQAKLNMSEKVCVNGNVTLNENIADNGGMKIAINAYKSWVARNGNEPRLPGLTQFTPHQLLFISFAQVWCGTISVQGSYNAIKNGKHSPGPYRVLGTMSNSEDFAEAFHCKKNSTMNPKLKCAFW